MIANDSKPTLDEFIARMKKEILEDVESGLVPVDCPSFLALHDYVDSSFYGGFCEDNETQALTEPLRIDEDECVPDDLVDLMNNAQSAVDRWIKEGGIKDFLNGASS